jgi:hypothetical protein
MRNFQPDLLGEKASLVIVLMIIAWYNFLYPIIRRGFCGLVVAADGKHIGSFTLKFLLLS